VWFPDFRKQGYYTEQRFWLSALGFAFQLVLPCLHCKNHWRKKKLAQSTLCHEKVKPENKNPQKSFVSNKVPNSF